MNQKRELFVNSVRTVPVDGMPVTPTVVRYVGKGYVIGHDALETESETDLIIDDFKLALGNGDYAQLARRMEAISGEQKRSVVGIAQDFARKALDYVEKWSHQHSISPPRHILVAEPLALEDATVPGESWLANYRSNVKRILHNFTEVDFLPEPFAVFQYYRYGVRHPLISERQKHVALVLDFGGGTFDASVIETTAQGDISQSGRNQRPFAAKSVAAAGFFINRKIAEHLLFKSSAEYQKNKTIRRALEIYSSGRGQDDDPSLSPEIRIFQRNFHKLVQRSEKAKVSICSSISAWDLDANLSAKVPFRIKVPVKPFSLETDFVEISLDAGDIKNIFETEIWKRKLLPTIVDVIRRASSELEGNHISIVLLSGGSSNIGWLRKLIERDLDAELSHAEILELAENFQEIVAKGLAVECARRYYTDGEGDFQAVLYNKLCLLLSPNDKGLEVRRFKPIEPTDLIDAGEEGVLLPSASSLRARFHEELRWKVRLSTPPSRNLSYHFMRSSFDPDDTEGKLNFVQTTVATPREASFGQAIDVGLTVREDGTATPRFVYGRGKAGREVVIEGTPFFLDMTSAAGHTNVDSYIGFDFRSSTSSFSIVSRADVHVYKERGQNPAWRELSDLVSTLPYPVAFQLARYLGETNPESIFKRGRSALESSLGFLAYLAYCEYRCNMGRQTSNLFKNLAHRSAGPLWALLQAALAKIPATNRKRSLFKLLDEPLRTTINDAVSEVAKEKHDKVASIDFNRILRPLANIICDTMEGKFFGYFEETRQRAFSSEYDGVFRSLSGANDPFVDLYDYSGPTSFSRNQVFCIDFQTGEALDMTPLYVWGLNSFVGDGRPADLYQFDNAKGTTYSSMPFKIGQK